MKNESDLGDGNALACIWLNLPFGRRLSRFYQFSALPKPKMQKVTTLQSTVITRTASSGPSTGAQSFKLSSL